MTDETDDAKPRLRIVNMPAGNDRRARLLGYLRLLKPEDSEDYLQHAADEVEALLDKDFTLLNVTMACFLQMCVDFLFYEMSEPRRRNLDRIEQMLRIIRDFKRELDATYD